MWSDEDRLKGDNPFLLAFAAKSCHWLDTAPEILIVSTEQVSSHELK